MRFPLLLKSVLCALLFGLILEAARPLCTVKSCSSISKRVSFIPRHIRPPGTPAVEQRALETVQPDPQSRANYVVKKVNALTPTQKIYDDKLTGESKSTSQWRPFVNSKNRWTRSFPLGLKKLTGCVSLVVISSRGIYATHFFEDVSLDSEKSATWAPRLLEGAQGFDRLESHFNDLNSSPSGGPNVFPAVYVISPVKMDDEAGSTPDGEDKRPGIDIGYDANGALEHPKTTQAIIAQVEALWPQINTIEVVKYYPLNKFNTRKSEMKNPSLPTDSDRLVNGPDGKILFEFDNDKGNIWIRFWVESVMEFEQRLA